MTVSATVTFISPLTVLAQVSTSAAQTAAARETNEIAADIQNQLGNRIAALQPATDTAVANATEAQINALQTRQSQAAALSPKFGANANALSLLQIQLANLQTAAANGNSAAFDAALSQANTDLSDLTVLSPPAPFQPDGIAGLQATGLGISSSSQYDLSTPAGQAAAAAAVSAAQTTVGNVFAATSANQLLAGDISTALTSQINQLSSQQQQQQTAAQSASQAQIQHLTQLAQEQEHVIELALGNTTELASAMFTATNPPSTVTSPLQVLQDAVGATAASSTAASNASPAILSLLGG